MKEVLVTIKVKVDQDVFEDYKDSGYSDQQIIEAMTHDFNKIEVDCRFVADFEVVDIKEVKE